MLLRNESKVKHSIEIKLVFDDNTKRELEIHVGECVQVSYRRNGCVRCGMGLIRDIVPYLKKYCQKPVESASIILDMSDDNEACVDRIDLDDIIDIKLVYPCGCPYPIIEEPQKPQRPCCDDNCKCNKIEEPPKGCDRCHCEKQKVQYSCLVGAVVTNKGVVAHE